MTTTATTTHKAVAPGPKGMPVFGNTFDLGRNPLQYYPEMRRRYGDVVRFHGVRGATWFLIAHPDDIEYVLKSKHYPKGIITDGLKVLVGNGLLTSEGEFWRRQRRLAAPAFHRQRLISLGGMMAQAGARAADRWRTAARTGQPVDVAADMMRATLEIVGRALFSVDVRGGSADCAASASVPAARTDDTIDS
jgi:cytochrome P450